MAIDVQIKAQLLQTVGIKHLSTSINGYGTKTYGTASTIYARVEEEVTLVTTADGEEKKTSHHIITEDVIVETDRLWLNGDSTSDATKARVPLAIRKARNEDGTVSHYETYV